MNHLILMVMKDLFGALELDTVVGLGEYRPARHKAAGARHSGEWRGLVAYFLQRVANDSSNRTINSHITKSASQTRSCHQILTPLAALFRKLTL